MATTSEHEIFTPTSEPERKDELGPILPPADTTSLSMVPIFSINFECSFLKMVGRNEPAREIDSTQFGFLSQNNTATDRDGNEFKQKCTIGTPLFYDSKPLPGVHVTLCCIKGDQVVETGEKVLDVKTDIDFAESSALYPVVFSKFGRATVIILGFNVLEDEKAYRALDQCGMSESPDLSERIFHVSIPINVIFNEDGTRTYKKAFDDVSDEKFNFWCRILDRLEFKEADSSLFLKMSSKIPC